MTAPDSTVQRWGLSNSRECLQSLRDKKIVGFLQGQLPTNRADLAKGTTTLVFEDGTGFTFSNHGSFWHESREDVMRALNRVAERMADAMDTYQSVLELAGGPESARPERTDDDDR